MSKFNDNVLCKLADKEFPKGLIEAIIKAGYVSCAGLAIVGGAEDHLQTWMTNDPKDITVDGVLEFTGQHKGKCIFLHFGKYPEKFHQDNTQPYVALFNEAGDTTMSAFFAGDYAKSAKAGTEQSDTLQVFRRLLLPTLTRADKANGGDIKKTYEELSSDPGLADTVSLYGDGNIALVCNEGILAFGEVKHQFDWGWVTDPCGYAEASKAEPKPADKKAGGFGGGPARPEGLKKEPETGASQVSLQTPSAVDPNKVLGIEGKDWQWDQPPSSYTKNQKHAYYEQVEQWVSGEWKKGIVPANYKDAPKVRVRLKKVEVVKDFKDIQGKVQTSEPKVSTEVLAVIPPKEKTYLQDVFIKKGHVQKTLNEGTVVPDPKNIEKLAKDWPSFIDAGGFDNILRTLFWTNEDRMDLIKNAPHAALVYMQDLSLALYHQVKDKDGNIPIIPMSVKLSDKEKHILAKEELKPSGFSSQKAAGGGFGKR